MGNDFSSSAAGGGATAPFASLDRLGIDAGAIDAAIAPFSAESGGNSWNRLLNRRRLKTVKRLVERLGGGRGNAEIREEYTHAWAAGYDRYRLDRRNLNPAPWLWRGRQLLLDPAAAARLRTLLFAAVIDDLEPKRILEVGSGNGINLLNLAGAFPGIEFTGLELTDEGVRQARSAQSDAEIAGILRAYSPLDTRDESAIGKIAFVQGDASAMPFEDSSFDLVMTVLAVEQMESIRAAALREIARVTRSHALMLEPFRDVNSRGLRRLYVKSRDYFRGSIDELRDYGLDPVWATDDFPQEAFLGTALVLARKTAAGPR